MLDQVGALVQEVWVALEDPLAVELRYQCKVHNEVDPSAQVTAARSAATPKKQVRLFRLQGVAASGSKSLP